MSNEPEEPTNAAWQMDDSAPAEQPAANTPPPAFPPTPEVPPAPMMPPPPPPVYGAGTFTPDGRPVEKSNLGTTALTLGVLSLVCSGVLGLILGPLAIHYANQAKQHPGADQKNADAGRILGIIGLVLSIISMLVGAVAIIGAFFSRTP